MSRTPCVWVVDDDPELRKLLVEFLGKNGFEVRALPDARDLERRLTRQRPDLLVLDLMLPGIDGLEICRRLRAAGDDIPIIMLTAKSDPIDRVVGIELGADDYLGKPFLPRELTARIHAVLRRRAPLPPGTPIADGNTVSFGECRLDLTTRTLWRGELKVDITSGEFALLSAFVRHPHQPLTRERLLELARGPSSETFDRSVDVQISRLRKLVEPDQGRPRHIQTVWGFGYVFVPDTSRAEA
ncbi:transcriptional regulatory protein OmpR [mine drainage metagenome]|uniref:Transcriptional regulatory protein OmpR n=1 Tax=mine drainage metagenome TaxID=410659 RepID=A0A1J5S1K6_9ZZZZ